MKNFSPRPSFDTFFFVHLQFLPPTTKCSELGNKVKLQFHYQNWNRKRCRRKGKIKVTGWLKLLHVNTHTYSVTKKPKRISTHFSFPNMRENWNGWKCLVELISPFRVALTFNFFFFGRQFGYFRWKKFSPCCFCAFSCLRLSVHCLEQARVKRKKLLQGLVWGWMVWVLLSFRKNKRMSIRFCL